MSSSEFKNILVIHFGQMGDVVLALPALSAIRKRFAESSVTVLCGKVAAEVVGMAGVADFVVPVDRVKLLRSRKVWSIGQILRLVRDVRSRRFDLVIDLHSLSETNILGFVSGAGSRLYANRESRSLDVLGKFDPRPPLEDKAKHMTERYFDVISPLGIGRESVAVKLRPSADDIQIAAGLLPSDSTPYAGLFPGAGHPSRRWPLKNFALIAELIRERGMLPVVLLGPEEAELKAGVSDKFGEGTPIVDGLTIAQFVAVCSRLSVFVGNDTGPVHLAGAAGAPVVLLLDGRAPTTYLPHAPALKIVRAETIAAIEVEQVFEAVLDLTSPEKESQE